MRETNFRKVEFSIVSLPKNERNATNHRKEKGIIAFLFLFVCLFVCFIERPHSLQFSSSHLQRLYFWQL